MEHNNPQQGVKHGVARRGFGTSPLRELWTAVHLGNVHDVDIALTLLKKNNVSVDGRTAFGSTALHIATWRNHVPIVKRLLAAGADPNARDGESGWSALHRALHFGHLAVAGVLIEAGASHVLEDSQGRTPVDLVSGPVLQTIANPSNAGITEVFSWGNGSNYQLGTGTAGIQKLPSRIDGLQGLDIVAVGAAKFHSVAVTSKGDIYSWGFGRGGRLGHSEFDIHSGQVAVITPRKITSGLGGRRISVVAAAKHHTVVATEGGEVYTWGSNREGQLGYPSVDSQPTPRRISSLKVKVVAVSASNKNSAAVSEAGEVYTWGCNKEGQLGYGTSNSASNCIPRSVEYFKGKALVAISSAKYHTVALGSEGEVYTWGYKMVMPRRVSIARNIKKSGPVPLKFHRFERLHVIAVAAGLMHSTAVSDDGSVFYWGSADPHPHAHQLLAFSRHKIISVAAGKYRTAVATNTGDIYIWDAEKCTKEFLPIPARLHGLKHIACLSVGETHSLAVSRLYMPSYLAKPMVEVPSMINPVDGLDNDNDDDDENIHNLSFSPGSERSNMDISVPPIQSLKDMCQRVIAETIVEPRNALQLLEVSDALDADHLRKYCEDMILRNLPYILTTSVTMFGHLRSLVLAALESSWCVASSEPWSHRRLPTPSALLLPILDNEDCEVCETPRVHPHDFEAVGIVCDGQVASEGFLHEDLGDKAVVKHVRALKKKLQQIETLEFKLTKGHFLDDQQLAKLQTKVIIVKELEMLESKSVPPLRQEDLKVSIDNSPREQVGGINGSGHQRIKPRRKVKGKGTQKTQESEYKKSKPEQVSPLPQKNEKTEDYQDSSRDLHDNYVAGPDVLDMGPSSTIKRKEDRMVVMSSTVSCTSGSLAAISFQKTSSSSCVDAQKTVQTPSSCQKSAKSKGRRGGLSMFLNGTLDACPQPLERKVSPPIVVKTEGPAWGGLRMSRGSSSLLEIQSQQIIESDNQVAFHASKDKEKLVGHGEKEMEKVDAGLRTPLSKFLRSSPIAMAPPKQSSAISTSPSAHSPPPWAEMSPGSKAKSLRDIQMQQLRTGTSIDKKSGSSGIGQASALVENFTNNSSRWFKPEVDNPSPLRCIQIEEAAMKDLRRVYKNVKLVQNKEKL